MQSGFKDNLTSGQEMISSSDDNCKQLVAGNYDVIINDSATESLKQVLTDYLEHFQHHERELVAQIQQQQQQQQQQQLQQEQHLQHVVPNSGSYVNEFKLLKELSKALKEDKTNLQIGEMYINQKKNRYKDIIPFSHTRVILQKIPQHGATKAPIDDNGSCYINANYIRGPSGSPRAYIACQGPLPCTLIDFWRMIWECNVSVVIMACNEYESGKPKCELYWSEQVESSHIYGNIQVTLLRVRQINSDFLIRKFSVKLLEPEPQYCDANIVNEHENEQANNNCATNDKNNNEVRHTDTSSPNSNNHDQRMADDCSPTMIETGSSKLTSKTNGNDFESSLSQSGTSSESLNTASDSASATSASATTNKPVFANNSSTERNHQTSHKRPRAVLAERTICQFHYTTWPDHGVPETVSPILELVRLVREVQPTEEKPLLVHCSAGCGRTGTICCIDYVWGLLRMGKLDSDFNLCRIISDMRQQRMAMVQTIEQYILCHRAVAALFIEQLQLMDSHLAVGSPEDCNETKDNQLDNDQAEEMDSDSFDSEQDIGPVFI